MGWMDCHLHEFTIEQERGATPIAIGLPEDEFDREVKPDWEVPVWRHFAQPGDECLYLYDFGDGWEHRVVLEDVHPLRRSIKYPICTDGERACPPEDCGGVPGYNDLLAILADPEHDEHEEMISWLSSHGDYWPYDPARFEPDRVTFDNPKKRLRDIRAV